MSFQIEGKLHEKYDTQQISDRFKKREFVLEIDEDKGYPQYPKFQLTQERCDLIEGYEKGEKLKAFFDLKARPYTNRNGETVYYTNLNVWKIERAQTMATPPSTSSTNEEEVPPYYDNIKDGPQVEYDKDLPF